MMTAFERVMYEVFVHTVVPKSVLLFILGKANAYRCIEKAKAQHLIREISFVSRNVVTVTRWTEDVLIITPEGVEYVRDHMTSVIPWATYIEKTIDKIDMFGGPVSWATIATRYGRITAAAVMATSIGARSEPTCFSYKTHEYDDDALLDDEVDAMLAGKSYEPPATVSAYGVLMASALQEYLDIIDRFGNTPFFADGRSDIEFLSAPQVKRDISKWAAAKEDKQPDIQGGRYCGILTSLKRAVLLYMVTPAAQLMWHKHFIEREIRAINIMKRIRIGYDHESKSISGMIIFTSVDMFKYTYNAHRTKANKLPANNREFGYGVEYLWAIPYSKDGCREMYSIMETSPYEENQKAIECLVKTGEFERKKLDPETMAFPLQSKSGILVAVNIHLDIKYIIQIERTVCKVKDKRFAVACFERQAPYYKAVLGDSVDIIVLDKYLPGYIQAWESISPELDIEIEARKWRSMLHRN